VHLLEMPRPFIGREALERQTQMGVTRRLVGLKMEGRAIPRSGYNVHARGDRCVGHVTSGGWSQALGAGIALALVDTASANIGTVVEVDIRGRKARGTVRADSKCVTGCLAGAASMG
jgi:aminomethyltransferase